MIKPAFPVVNPDAALSSHLVWAALMTDDGPNNVRNGGTDDLTFRDLIDPASTQLNNAFSDDPIRLLGDVTRRGHRLACDERALEGILVVKDFDAFARLARDAAEKAVA